MANLSTGNGGQGTSKPKVERPTQQVALKNEAINIIDELIDLETGERIGSISRADVLNHLLVKKGAAKIREFIYSK